MFIRLLTREIKETPATEHLRDIHQQRRTNPLVGHSLARPSQNEAPISCRGIRSASLPSKVCPTSFSLIYT